MKRLFLLLMVSISFYVVQAQIAPFPQVPAAFNYQGVARSITGEPLANKTIKVYSSIITPATQVFGLNRFYIEKRTVTTNAFGLFSIQIGGAGADSVGGSFPSSGIFEAWGPNLHLHTDIVLPNTTALISLGDTKLASVPYSLYARAARPWSYTVSETIPGSTNFTIYPDKNYWNLGLGTAEATEKLHVVGRIRMQDGTQGNGFVMTSDANGVATWKAPTTSPWGRTGNRTFLLNNNDSVGIGVTNATAKLDVVGKFRLRDGTEFVGYNLVSDQFGVASWKKPDWTTYDNNTVHTIFPTDINRSVGIGTINPGTKLHVNGTLRFEGNGPLAEGNVLTVGFGGNAVWRAPNTDPANSYWLPATFANIPMIRSSTSYENRPYWSFSRFVVNKDMNANYTDDYLNINNYPMAVQNSKHGIAVVINGAAQQSKKFISFFDNGFANRYRGAIEGQTLTELQDDPTYVAYIVIQLLQTVGLGLEAGACAIQGDLAEAPILIIQVASWATDMGVTIDNMESNVGVAYTSGSADYAEWLERADPNEKFGYGDIISVNGGKISKKLTGSGQLMVISKAPIVLGNVPDETKKANYEKVAFMGQVPVKVLGKVAIGDYIVAFANGTGLGYAVNPSKISTDEMGRIVGVAWSASGNGELSMINTAVGVNTQATNQLIQKQDDEISLLKNTINQLSAYLHSKDSSFQYSKFDAKPVQASVGANPAVADYKPVLKNPLGLTTGFSKLSADERIKKLNSISMEKIKTLIYEKPQFIDAAMKAVKEKIEANGHDLNSNPELKRMLTDRAYMIEKIKDTYKIL